MADYYVYCDVCGFQYKRSECLKRWDGRLVCKKDFELRHPQDFLKPKAENQSVPDGRAERVDPPLVSPQLSVDDLI